LIWQKNESSYFALKISKSFLPIVFVSYPLIKAVPKELAYLRIKMRKIRRLALILHVVEFSRYECARAREFVPFPRQTAKSSGMHADRQIGEKTNEFGGGNQLPKA
jgi:hypothetical protein